MSSKRAPELVRPGVAMCLSCHGQGVRHGYTCGLCGGSGEMSLTFDRAAREGRLFPQVCDECLRRADCLNVGTWGEPVHLCARCEMERHGPEAEKAAQEFDAKVADGQGYKTSCSHCLGPATCVTKVTPALDVALCRGCYVAATVAQEVTA